MPKRPPCAGTQALLPRAPALRLLLLPDVADPEGGPRPALLLNQRAGKLLLRARPRIAAALTVKRGMEAAQ